MPASTLLLFLLSVVARVVLLAGEALDNAYRVLRIIRAAVE